MKSSSLHALLDATIKPQRFARCNPRTSMLCAPRNSASEVNTPLHVTGPIPQAPYGSSTAAAAIPRSSYDQPRIMIQPFGTPGQRHAVGSPYPHTDLLGSWGSRRRGSGRLSRRSATVNSGDQTPHGESGAANGENGSS